jgi:hypothetical protein
MTLEQIHAAAASNHGRPWPVYVYLDPDDNQAWQTNRNHPAPGCGSATWR